MAETSQNTGAGQQDPADSNSDFDVTCFIIRQMMAQLDTMKLVKVMAVTGGGGALAHAGTVDVQPLVNLIDGSGNATKHGTVYGIPWMRLQGGTGAVILDPAVGDVGYVLCADRDISNVKGLTPGSVVQANPGSYRKYSIADGVYVGGLLNEVPAQYIAFSDSGIKIADRHGNVVETSATGIAITPKSGSPVTVNGPLVVTGNFQLGGSLLAQPGGVYGGNLVTSGAITSGTGGSAVTLRTHTHTQAADSHGDTEQPTAAPTGGT